MKYTGSDVVRICRHMGLAFQDRPDVRVRKVVVERAQSSATLNVAIVHADGAVQGMAMDESAVMSNWPGAVDLIRRAIERWYEEETA